ncbi:UbiA family prenyltransferase [Desulfurobacterium sp.]
MTVAEKLKAFVRLSKPFKFLTMVYPFLLGTVIAIWDEGHIDVGLFLVSFSILMLAVECVYVQNDVADLKTDSENPSKFTGGSKVLVEGLISPGEALFIAYASGILAVLLGLVFVFKYRFSWNFYFLCFVLFLIAYGYTGWPFRFAYRGLGEVVLAFTNAVAPTLIAYMFQTRHFSWLPVIMSLPYMISVFAQKVLREFPDYEPDRKAGKRNLVVRFGKERMAVVYVASLYLYIFVLILAVLYLMRLGLSVLATFPVAYLFISVYKLIDTVRKNRDFYNNYEVLKVMNGRGFKLMFDTNIVLILVLGIDLLIKAVRG